MHEYIYGSSSFLLFSVLFFSGSLSCPPVSCTSFEQLLPAACSASVVLMMTVETNIENFHVINACVTGHILFLYLYEQLAHTLCASSGSFYAMQHQMHRFSLADSWYTSHNRSTSLENGAK